MQSLSQGLQSSCFLLKGTLTPIPNLPSGPLFLPLGTTLRRHQVERAVRLPGSGYDVEPHRHPERIASSYPYSVSDDKPVGEFKAAADGGRHRGHCAEGPGGGCLYSRYCREGSSRQYSFRCELFFDTGLPAYGVLGNSATRRKVSGGNVSRALDEPRYTDTPIEPLYHHLLLIFGYVLGVLNILQCCA